ncbi:MAG: PIN domain-containing protein, partial [Gemmatimonadetes bacterium]|nr:PIN domain-containing protein [Gemmatimonadota bacterium]
MRLVRARDVLLDTGPIVATLDASDQWHDMCVGAVTSLLDRCVTTEAVLTEACHLVGRGRARASLVLDFLLDAEIPILALDRPAVRHAARLMDQYAKVPMDFADAALVTLADGLQLGTVLTTDRRGFRSYRPASGKPFRVYPEVVLPQLKCDSYALHSLEQGGVH